MPRPLSVAVVYNQPVLAADDPDFASEAGVLEAVDAIAAALERRGHHVRQLGLAATVDEIIDALRGSLDVDVVVNLFEGLGGTGAAEGQISGLIELCGPPITGSPSQCLALVQDKPRTKWLLAGAGLPTAPFFQFGPDDPLSRAELEAALRAGPYIVKPAREDASLGISPESVVESFSQLERQVATVRARYGDVLVERFIAGRELNVGVIDLGDGPRVLPLAEILFEPGATGRWDLLTYDAKWKPESAACVRTPVVCPATVAPRLAARIEEIALAAFRVTGCRDYARVDLRVDHDGEPLILEINGNPDLSPSAGFARALRVAGFEYDQFIERLVACAARRKGLLEREPAERVASSAVVTSADGVPVETIVPSARRLALLFGALYFLQGIGEPTDGLISQPTRTLLKSWGDGPAEVTAFVALLSLPWSLKPLYGLLTDFVLLAGYRRKSYLVATSLLALVGFLALACFPPSAGAHGWLMLLILPTLGIAFGDVVVDALMIEQGQPRGLTGKLQSIQWAAIYSASILTGVAGGFLSERQLYSAALSLSALTAFAMFVLSLAAVDEPPRPRHEDGLRGVLQELRVALMSPVVLSVCLFIFLYEFNPVSTAVLHLHLTEQLGLSEQFFGLTRSAVAVGSIVGAAGYGFYCRHVPMRRLVHLAIVAGIASTSGYYFVHGQATACAMSFTYGVCYMTGLLVLLDLAAQACPPVAAGTIFALIMALSNLGESLATYLGGQLYQAGIERWGHDAAFDALITLGAVTTSACWLAVPLLPRRLVP